MSLHLPHRRPRGLHDRARWRPVLSRPEAPRRHEPLRDASGRAADYASLANCPDCGTDHEGLCPRAVAGLPEWEMQLAAEQGGWPTVPFAPVAGQPPWELAAGAEDATVLLPEAAPALVPPPEPPPLAPRVVADVAGAVPAAGEDEMATAVMWADEPAERIAEPHERMAGALHPEIVTALRALTVEDAIAEIFGYEPQAA